jgi:monoamine oxidase
MGNYDVIVIGAGFAGSMAARTLSQAGHSVLVLEGRDRLGGRTWYKEFGETEHKVEFGGTWVVPQYQHHIAEEINHYGLELVDSPTPQIFAYSLGGKRTQAPFPIPMDQWMDFERAITYIDTNAARIKFGTEPLHQDGLEDLDVPFEEWLDQIKPPTETREFLLAWASFYFGQFPDKVSALHILSWVAGFDNSSVGWFVGVSEKFLHGTKSLIEAIHGDITGEVRLSTKVSAVSQDDAGVTVTLADGTVERAKTCVVATAVNTWKDITFEPALGGSFGAMASEGQAGQSTKVWALVGNVPENFYGVGYDTKIKWLATEYTVPEGTLLVGFGCGTEELDVDDKGAIKAAVHEFLPDADVLEVDAHNWNTDEFAQGTWMAYRPGQVVAHARALQQPVGRIAFAGSDLASGWAGWMDGALESGKRAAAQVESVLEGGAA